MYRHSTVLALALAALASMGSVPGRADAPWLGEPFPPPAGITWLGAAPAAPGAGGRITLVEFWASWSPASRLLLAEQDRLLRAQPELPLEILAISHEEPAALEVFLTEAGWQALKVGSDASRDYWRATFGAVNESADGRGGVLPFAFIVGETASGPGRLLWMGPLVETGDADPRAAFASALAAIRAGDYDLAAAQAVAHEELRSLALVNELEAATAAGDFPRASALLDTLAGLRLHPALRGSLADRMNGLAWRLVGEGRPAPAALALAEQALALGAQHGGDKDGGFVDTQARAAHLQGDLKLAIALQRRAIALAPTSSIAAELLPALNEYLAAAGLPAEAGAAAGPVASATWSGSLNAAGERLRGPEALHVRPLPPADAELARRWDEEVAALRGRFFGETTLATPDTLTDDQLSGRPLLLYGTPAANPVLARVLAAQGIVLQPDGVRFGEVFLAAENPVLIAALPHPLTPALPVKIHTAFREEDAQGVNRFFHGPSAVMVGHWEAGKPVVLAALDFAPGDPDAKGRRPLALGPAFLTAAQGQADLAQLHELLIESYAGYADIEWALSRQGSSWAAHTDAALSRLGERERWSSADYFAAVVDYLAPVQDSHFYIQGSSLADGRYVERKESCVRQWWPFFTGIRLRGMPAGLRVVEAPPGLAIAPGAELVAPPLISSPHAAVAGEPRLFPTLPGPAGEREYLLGCLSTQAEDSLSLPVALKSTRRARDGRPAPSQTLDVAAHRGRLGRSPRSREPWAVAREADSGWASVSLRTMSQGSLAGFPESADSLRAAAGLLLDLRGNGGGSDTPGMQWVQRLSGQPFDWVGHVAAVTGSADQACATSSHPGSRLPLIAGESVPQAPAPFTRPVQVLMDKGVASSGETMVLLAGQLAGAVLLGENTAGCSAYGNVQELGPLAHSRIRLHCGRSRFVQDWVRPMVEGVGFFPDYWLDTEDPLALLATRRNLERPAP